MSLKTDAGNGLFIVGCIMTGVWVFALLFGVMWYGPDAPVNMILGFLVAFIPAAVGYLARRMLAAS